MMHRHRANPLEKRASEAFIRAMEEAHADPACIYAFKKLGFVVSDTNIDFISDEQLAEWDSAVLEYEAMNGVKA